MAEFPRRDRCLVILHSVFLPDTLILPHIHYSGKPRWVSLSMHLFER
ncbi:MAG: hypothetical protein GX620_13940 [Chloroflexi bacterium]|nr:hypothetical protein [Chloroflexota bacterium]